MKKLLVLLVLSLSFFSINVNASENESEEYIIQKGDTLWDISDTKLKDTFLWPKLWSVNPHVDNPDMIYPGLKIRIPSREELMRVSPLPVKRTAPQVKARKKPFRKAPKLKRQYVVDRNRFIASGWIDDGFPSVGKIIYSPGDRRVLGKDEIAYLQFSSDDYSSSSKTKNIALSLVRSKEDIAGKDKLGKEFYVIRNIKLVRHPVTDKKLGYQIRVVGVVKIIGQDSEMPKAKITRSFEDINVGDGLMPYKHLEPPLITDKIQTPAQKGYIVETHLNSVLSEEGTIIFLDKGQKDGVKPGDIYSVFSDSPTESPIGEIRVVLSKPTTSNAVVLESVHEILTGDKWGQKK